MKKADSIWTYNFVSLFITNGVMFFGQTMMSTLLPKYLSAMGHGSEIIGIVVGMFSITALGTRPVSGPLIDGMNKKKLYMTMLSFLTITSFGYAFSESIPIIIVFRLLHGIGMGCNAALAMTMAADCLPESKLAYGMGIYGMSSILAMAFGPGIGLYVAEAVSYKVAFCISGTLLLISLIVASRMRIKLEPDKKIVFSLNNVFARECAMPAFLLLLVSIARISITTYIAIYITEVRMIDGITVYYLINAAALLVSRPLLGKIADKYGIHISLIPSYLSFAAALVLLAFCQNTWQLWLVGVFNALGYGAGQTQLQAMALKLTAPSRRGAASTTAFIGTDIGDLIGPVVAGFIIARQSYDAMFLWMIIPIVLCAAVMFIWQRRRPGLLSPAPEDTSPPPKADTQTVQ